MIWTLQIKINLWQIWILNKTRRFYTPKSHSIYQWHHTQYWLAQSITPICPAIDSVTHKMAMVASLDEAVGAAICPSLGEKMLLQQAAHIIPCFGWCIGLHISGWCTCWLTAAASVTVAVSVAAVVVMLTSVCWVDGAVAVWVDTSSLVWWLMWRTMTINLFNESRTSKSSLIVGFVHWISTKMIFF